MKDYSLLLTTYYPDIKFNIRGDRSNYNNINFIFGNVSEAELNIKYIDYLKQLKIEELSLQTRELIESGFISNCLGVSYFYDGKIEDQINIAGAVSIAEAQGSFVFPTKDPVTKDNKTYRHHTYAQLQQLAVDGGSFKLTLLSKFNILKQYIINLDSNNTTEEYINSITLDFQVS